MLFARVLDNAPTCSDGLHAAQATGPSNSGRHADHPVIPVLIGDDWQAVLLWRALYDAGVYMNVAIHPAVPPGGALLGRA